MLEFIVKLLPENFASLFGKSKRREWNSAAEHPPAVEDDDWDTLRLHPLASSLGAGRQKRPTERKDHQWGYRGQEVFLEHKRTYQNLKKLDKN